MTDTTRAASQLREAVESVIADMDAAQAEAGWGAHDWQDRLRAALRADQPRPTPAETGLREAVIRAARATNWRDRIAALNEAIALSGEPDATL